MPPNDPALIVTHDGLPVGEVGFTEAIASMQRMAKSESSRASSSNVSQSHRMTHVLLQEGICGVGGRSRARLVPFRHSKVEFSWIRPSQPSSPFPWLTSNTLLGSKFLR